MNGKNGKASIKYNNREFSYLGLNKQIAKTEVAYKKIDIKKLDVVTICDNDKLENIIDFYALNNIGAITNLVRIEDLINNPIEYIDATGSKCLIISEEYYRLVQKKLGTTMLDSVLINTEYSSKNDLFKLFLKEDYSHLEFIKGINYYKKNNLIESYGVNNSLVTSNENDESDCLILNKDIEYINLNNIDIDLLVSNSNIAVNILRYNAPLVISNDSSFMSVLLAVKLKKDIIIIDDETKNYEKVLPNRPFHLITSIKFFSNLCYKVRNVDKVDNVLDLYCIESNDIDDRVLDRLRYLMGYMNLNKIEFIKEDINILDDFQINNNVNDIRDDKLLTYKNNKF